MPKEMRVVSKLRESEVGFRMFWKEIVERWNQVGWRWLELITGMGCGGGCSPETERNGVPENRCIDFPYSNKQGEKGYCNSYHLYYFIARRCIGL